jgi:aspartate racemase
MVRGGAEDLISGVLSDQGFETETVKIMTRISRRQVIAATSSLLVAGVARRGPAQAPPASKPPVLKTIGVLGGIGPQATMDFEQRVHRAAQQLIPQHFNSGYPPMVVFYLRHPPVLVAESGAPVLPLQLDPRTLEAAKRLGGLSDLLVTTANGADAFRTDIERASGRKMLSLIELAAAETRRRRWKRVGVLGVGEPTVYTRLLEPAGIECTTADAEQRAALDAAIFRVMEGRDNEQSVAAAKAAVAQLRSRKVDGVILGCTEIPLLLGAEAEAADVINPAQLLAEAAVKAAMQSAPVSSN